MKSKVVVKCLQILDRRNTIWNVVIQASVFRQRQGETDHPVGNDPNAGDKWEHLVSHHLGEALVTTTTPSSLILMNGKYHLHLTEVGNPHPHEPSLVWADARVIWNPSLLAPQPCWFIFFALFSQLSMFNENFPKFETSPSFLFSSPFSFCFLWASLRMLRRTTWQFWTFGCSIKSAIIKGRGKSRFHWQGLYGEEKEEGQFSPKLNINKNWCNLFHFSFLHLNPHAGPPFPCLYLIPLEMGRSSWKSSRHRSTWHRRFPELTVKSQWSCAWKQSWYGWER